MEHKVLFKTRHGSHLYGLNHADSDEDFYTVLERPRGRRYKWAKQSIVDGEDSLRVDLPTWLRLCEKGVPQALEAMFSTEPMEDNLPFLRASYRAGGEVRRTYARTITNFVYTDEFKRRRHAVRLAYNLNDLLKYGRFNPRMTPGQIEIANSLALDYHGEGLLDKLWLIAYRSVD